MPNQPSVIDPLNLAKKMWGNMGLALPNMMTPTLDVGEIEKKIADLKAVENWLKMNLSMLQMTIQGLEMQCVTLNAVHALGHMASSYSATPPAETAQPTAVAGGEVLKMAAMWPWNLLQQMNDQIQQAAAAAGQGDDGGSEKS